MEKWKRDTCRTDLFLGAQILFRTDYLFAIHTSPFLSSPFNDPIHIKPPMLGRNAARPFGMTPTRLMAVYSTAASQRISHWITKPFALVHMQRYISVAPQLLLTSSNSSSHSAARVLSATHIESLHTASVQQQQHQQHQTQSSLHDLEAPQKSVLESSSITSPSPNGSTAVTSSPSGVTFNYLLAASWHPKSRQRKSYAMTTNASSSDEESKTKWWKQKLRIGKVDAGEDAFFHVSTPSRVALGVADGVGGWSEVSQSSMEGGATREALLSRKQWVSLNRIKKDA